MKIQFTHADLKNILVVKDTPQLSSTKTVQEDKDQDQD